MSSAKKAQNPPGNLPRKTVEKSTAAKVKGGVEPINDRLKPAEPVNGIRTK